MVEKNPDWTEEELILAYWVYKRHRPACLSARDQTVRKLSDLLIALPVHPPEERLSSFRMPDGVRRRLDYLRAIDDGDEVAGHNAYKEVVEAFRTSPDALDRKCEAILQKYGKDWEYI